MFNINSNIPKSTTSEPRLMIVKALQDACTEVVENNQNVKKTIGCLTYPSRNSCKTIASLEL